MFFSLFTASIILLLLKYCNHHSKILHPPIELWVKASVVSSAVYTPPLSNGFVINRPISCLIPRLLSGEHPDTCLYPQCCDQWFNSAGISYLAQYHGCCPANRRAFISQYCDQPFSYCIYNCLRFGYLKLSGENSHTHPDRDNKLVRRSKLSGTR